MSFISMIVVVALLIVGMAAVAAIANDETTASLQPAGMNAIIVVQPNSYVGLQCATGTVMQTLPGPDAMAVRCVHPTPTPAPTATPRRGNG